MMMHGRFFKCCANDQHLWQESKESLVRILNQVNTSTLSVGDVPLQSAIDEANQLVVEVDAMLA